MVDRSIGVGGEFSAVESESLVEADAGAEGEDARGDAGEQSGWGAAAALFEQELVFERVDDRLDPLADLEFPRFRGQGLQHMLGLRDRTQLVITAYESGFVWATKT